MKKKIIQIQTLQWLHQNYSYHRVYALTEDGDCYYTAPSSDYDPVRWIKLPDIKEEEERDLDPLLHG